MAPKSPVAVSPLKANDIVGSVELESARMRFQYPIARAARAIQVAADRRDEYEGVLALGEAIAITLGASITAGLRDITEDVPAFQALQAAFLARGVAEGHWINVIGATFSLIKGRSEVMLGLEKALQPGPRGSGLVADLKCLVEERNRWAHGARPRTPIEAELRLAEIAVPLKNTLDRCSFLAESPWLLTTASSYSRRQGDFLIAAAAAMGDHPDFQRQEFTSNTPLANGTFYLMSADGAVDLTPLIVMQYCDKCHQQELCYADRLDARDGVAFKSFARGHVIFDHTLDDEIRTILDSVEKPPKKGTYPQ